jgi:hypothetical protein
VPNHIFPRTLFFWLVFGLVPSFGTPIIASTKCIDSWVKMAASRTTAHELAGQAK